MNAPRILVAEDEAIIRLDLVETLREEGYEVVAEVGRGDEALRMGLANRLSEPGQALTDAMALAADLAAFPQRCLRSDRLSSLEQWSLSPDQALANEYRLGMATVASGETQEGATRFARGEGRHGSFD